MSGGPESKRAKNGFLGIREPFWLKPFYDLNLATVLAIEHVSVINDFKGSEWMQEQRKSCQETIAQ